MEMPALERGGNLKTRLIIGALVLAGIAAAGVRLIGGKQLSSERGGWTNLTEEDIQNY